jgi:hypothetical protein
VTGRQASLSTRAATVPVSLQELGRSQ